MVASASLVGAVADSIAEVDFGAVASDVALGAAKVASGNGNHVADAGLATLRQVGKSLSHGHGGANGKDGEGLHSGEESREIADSRMLCR